MVTQWSAKDTVPVTKHVAVPGLLATGIANARLEHLPVLQHASLLEDHMGNSYRPHRPFHRHQGCSGKLPFKRTPAGTMTGMWISLRHHRLPHRLPDVLPMSICVQPLSS